MKKIIFLVEGHTELALKEFLKRAIKKFTAYDFDLNIINFKGNNKLLNESSKKVKLLLENDNNNEIIAIISIIDLYQAYDFERLGLKTVEDKYDYVETQIESSVNNPIFKHFSAVHEFEAWLLSDPEIFPDEIKKELAGKYPHPEDVNFDNPPASILKHLYYHKLSTASRIRKYHKVSDGSELLTKLNPDDVYKNCRYFKKMIDHIICMIGIKVLS